MQADYHEIEPRLFLGTLLAFDQKFCQLTNKSHNVKLIIRCLPDDEYDSTSAKEICQKANVELLQIPITDEANQNILLHLAAVQKIHETLTTSGVGGGVFVSNGNQSVCYNCNRIFNDTQRNVDCRCFTLHATKTFCGFSELWFYAMLG
eukprot:PhF_6_TR7995/c1_g3_i1/m.12303